MSCMVKECKNLKRLIPENAVLSFHRLPKDKNRRKQWLSALNITTEIPDKAVKFVCSNHFENDQFLTYTEIRVLVPSAVPSLFVDKKIFTPTSNFYDVPTSSEGSPKMKRRTPAITSAEEQESISQNVSHGTLLDEKLLSNQPESVVPLDDDNESLSPAVKMRFLKLDHNYCACTEKLESRRNKKLLKLDHNYCANPGNPKKKIRASNLKCRFQSKSLGKVKVKMLKKKVIEILSRNYTV